MRKGGDSVYLTLAIRIRPLVMIYSQRNGSLYHLEICRSHIVAGLLHRSYQLQWIGHHTADGLGVYNGCHKRPLLMFR